MHDRCGSVLIMGDDKYLLDFFFQAEDGIRDSSVTGVQTCALPIFREIETAVRIGCPRKIKIESIPFGLFRNQGNQAACKESARGIHDRAEIGRASCRERV